MALVRTYRNTPDYLGSHHIKTLQASDLGSGVSVQRYPRDPGIQKIPTLGPQNPQNSTYIGLFGFLEKIIAGEQKLWLGNERAASIVPLK